MKSRTLVFILFAVELVLGGTQVLSGQTLKITPSHVMVDEIAVIRADGLQPNERVSLRAELVDGQGKSWASQAEFLADAQGTVDVSKQAPVSGSYKEVSPMGLVWAMMPAGTHAAMYNPPKDLAPQTVNFTLVRNGEKVSQADLVQAWVGDGVKEIKIQGQIHGALFLPASAGRHPGVLVLGGSEGGAPWAKAAWLASHGYAALALAYFRYEGMPDYLQAIPLEYFGRALGWMSQRPEILPDRIAVVGTSRGGELALQLGSMYPTIKAVVAYVPANFRHGACCGRTLSRYAWTWQGMPLPYANMNERDPAYLMPATIPVEHTHGPILLIAGEDDGVWDSPEMTHAIVTRLKQTHFSYGVERYEYPHAGHRAGRPEIVPTWHYIVKRALSGRDVSLGGSAEGDAHSSIDAIPKVLDFLQHNLQAGLPLQAAQQAAPEAAHQPGQTPAQLPAKPN
jgi:dienelactone hydrolase